jgi:hypothetical protein
MSKIIKSDGSAGQAKHRLPVPNSFTVFCESFGLSRAVATSLFMIIVLMLAAAVFCFIYSAPPQTITMVTGPEGSTFHTNAVNYAAILKREGVKLKILTSQGSLDNLQQLNNPAVKVDVGFVQGGLTNVIAGKLVSLGSISYQPLLVFYRGAPVDTLAGLAGRRLAVGPKGSGTRNLVLTLLATNGIAPGGTTTLLDWDSQRAADALQAGTVDAVFLMGEDASRTVIRKLLLAPDIQLMNFAQAEAYSRKFNYLSVLKMPEGAIDLGKNIPSHDVYLIGPTVELIARDTLHPALSDLLLEAAQEMQGNAGMFQHKGEFPAIKGDDFPVSSDAVRFYKSGKSFFYSHLPFWMASLTSRIVVVILPMIVILIPIVRSIPHMYRWRNQARIYRWYRALLVVERELGKEPDAKKREHLHQRLDEIEREVNKMKVPAFLANQFYSLRQDIAQVRELAEKPGK